MKSLKGRISLTLKRDDKGTLFFYEGRKIRERAEGMVIALKNGEPYLPSSLSHSRLKKEGITIGYIKGTELVDTGVAYFTPKGNERTKFIAEAEKSAKRAERKYQKELQTVLTPPPVKKAEAKKTPPKKEAKREAALTPKKKKPLDFMPSLPPKREAKKTEREREIEKRVAQPVPTQKRRKAQEKYPTYFKPKGVRVEKWSARRDGHGKLFLQPPGKAEEIQITGIQKISQTGLEKLNRFLKSFNHNSAILYMSNDKENVFTLRTPNVNKTEFNVPVKPYKITRGGKLTALKEWHSKMNITEQMAVEQEENIIKPEKLTEAQEKQRQKRKNNTDYTFSGDGESMERALAKLGVDRLPYIKSEDGFYSLYGKVHYITKKGEKIEIPVAVNHLNDPTKFIREIAISLRKALVGRGYYFTAIPVLEKYHMDYCQEKGLNPFYDDSPYTTRIQNIRDLKLKQVKEHINLAFDIWQTDYHGQHGGTERRI